MEKVFNAVFAVAQEKKLHSSKLLHLYSKQTLKVETEKKSCIE
jgi:hypothetical protein